MKNYFFALISFVVFFAGPNAYADTFTWVGVFSNVGEYDQNDFPGQPGWSIVSAEAFVDENPANDPVTLDSTPTGNGVPLPWRADLGAFYTSFTSPPIGSAWQTTYTFHSGVSTEVLDLSDCTFRELSVPQATISNGGKTISWSPVPYATYYRLRWYNIDPNTGLPTGAMLAQTGDLTDTSYTMQDPPPSGTTLAVRIEAREHCSATNKLINISMLYKIDAITDTPIPTLSEWGMIIFACLIVGSTVYMMRRRKSSGRMV